MRWLARGWHRITHKRGSGRPLLLVVSGDCWAGASWDVSRGSSRVGERVRCSLAGGVGVLFVLSEGRTLVSIQSSDPPRLVRVGIDAAVVAQHEVCLRVTDPDGWPTMVRQVSAGLTRVGGRVTRFDDAP